jgi:hypothetical protein
MRIFVIVSFLSSGFSRDSSGWTPGALRKDARLRIASGLRATRKLSQETAILSFSQTLGVQGKIDCPPARAWREDGLA